MTSQPTTTPVERADTDAALEPPFRLVLLDDNEHTYEYVIEMLGSIFGYASEKAFALARMVDAQGRVTVETSSHEQVTRHQTQIHGYGPDPRIATCKGSMSAIVEEAG